MKTYKYDIAISLCKEDVDFARQLVKELNPKLDVFFYEDRQEEIISKSAFEVFSRVFAEDTRVVVILHRENWVKTPYTQLENDAIVERFSKEGAGFIFLIPLEPGKKPTWYPNSRIYASPQRFSVEQLARFLEFKVTDEGGEVTPLTFEEKAKLFTEKLDQRVEHRNYLQSQESFELARNELVKLGNAFNAKAKQDRISSLPYQTGHRPLHMGVIISMHSNNYGLIHLHDYTLQLTIDWEDSQYRESSQAFKISFLVARRWEYHGEMKELESAEYYFNTDRQERYGWSEISRIASQDTRHEEYYYLKDFIGLYELGTITGTEELLEGWFLKLFNIAEMEYKDLLN